MKNIEEGMREEVRSEACLYVCIHGEDTENPIGILADLSTKGFKLLSEAEIETDKEYSLQIKNPYIPSGDSYGAFTAKALWCNKQRDKAYYSGFIFSSHSAESELLFPRLQEAFEKVSLSAQA